MDIPGQPAQPHSAAEAASRATWFEIGAIVFLVCAPTLSSLGRSLFWGRENVAQNRHHAEHQTGTEYEMTLFDSMIARLRYVPVVLFVMWRSGQGLARFGLVKPKIVKDILTGLSLWLAVATFDAIISLAFNRQHPWLVFSPVAIPWHRVLLILGECCAIGFSEELTFRAYLIPRLETVTGATWIGVVLSVFLFGFVHLYKGYVGALHSLVAAVVWSLGFCLTRRIWPLALSHALGDFIVGTHQSSITGL